MENGNAGYGPGVGMKLMDKRVGARKRRKPVRSRERVQPTINNERAESVAESVVFVCRFHAVIVLDLLSLLNFHLRAPLLSFHFSSPPAIRLVSFFPPSFLRPVRFRHSKTTSAARSPPTYWYHYAGSSRCLSTIDLAVENKSRSSETRKV